MIADYCRDWVSSHRKIVGLLAVKKTLCLALQRLLPAERIAKMQATLPRGCISSVLLETKELQTWPKILDVDLVQSNRQPLQRSLEYVSLRELCFRGSGPFRCNEVFYSRPGYHQIRVQDTQMLKRCLLSTEVSMLWP